MPNIVIEIRMPDFIKAAEILASAMGVLKARSERTQPLPSEKPQVTPPAAPKTPEPEQTVNPITTQVQAPNSPPPAPSNPVTPVIPTAPPTTFSVEEIQTTAASLMQTKQKEVHALLKSFNVGALTDMTDEQRGLFMQGLRALGAGI